MRSTRTVGGDLLIAISIAVAGAVSAELLRSVFSATRMSSLFLAPVVVAGYLRGRDAALAAAGLGVVFYRIFLQFQVGEQPRLLEDAVNFTVFVGVALLTGSLAGRLRDEVDRSQARARTMELLFDVSRRLHQVPDESGVWKRLCGAITSVSGNGSAVVVDASARPRANLGTIPECAHALAREVLNGPLDAANGGWRATALRDGDTLLGAAAWPETEAGEPDTPNGPLDLVLQIGSASLARERAAEMKGQVEAAEATARLREALLSSLSHDFRSPLSAILASASSLLEYGDKFSPEVREDLLHNIAEEAERLNHYVGTLLNMSRLHTGELTARVQRVGVADMVTAAAERLSRHSQKPVPVTFTGGCDVVADPTLLEQALYNLLDNAMKHGNGAAGLEVSTKTIGSSCEIAVADHGEGLSEAQMDAAFDRLPRHSGRPHGMGLGLSIVKGFVEAMGGKVRACRRGDGDHGLIVCITLPKVS